MKIAARGFGYNEPAKSGRPRPPQREGSVGGFVRNIVVLYLAIGVIIGVLSYVMVAHVNAPLASIERCHNKQNDADGLAAAAEMPNVLVYSAIKGLSWPYALYRDVVQSGVQPLDWLLGRYDPFPNVCR